MRIIEDTKLDFDSVLILPKRSTLKSRSEVSLTRSFRFKHSGVEWCGKPIIAANMDGVGTIEMYNALSQNELMTALHKHYTEDQLLAFYKRVADTPFAWYSTGIGESDLNKLDTVVNKARDNQMKECVNFICVDVANGYTETFVDVIKKIRDKYPNKTIMAGNVVTPEMTEELILAGADIVKVGIGSGSVCTTRLVAGVGYPQLSAVIECSDAAHGLGGHICSDGGCVTPADVAKAFAAGADFVMLGSMLAGHDEGGGEVKDADVQYVGYKQSKIDVQQHGKYIHIVSGRKGTEYGVPDNDLWVMTNVNPVYTMSHPLVKKYPDLFKITLPENPVIQFYGMSSSTAMDKHNGGVAEYRSSEGRTVELPYRGAVKDTVNYILGGVRSTCTYTGSRRLKELSKRTTFVRVNNTHSRIYENVTTKIR